MIIEQIYTGCLAQGAYYLESKGEAAIIDPLRDIDVYLEKAERNGARIKYIFETHFHADFVSGHLDLAKKTGAKIVYGPLATTKYEKYEAHDGEVFPLGDISLKVLHTPGHTPESTTYLLLDETGRERAIFSGDTLFIGDVGRPDLAQNGTLTKEDLAGTLFDSLREKIMPLPDDVIVYPAHGAGSACGKKMSRETTDTLGNQKATNYALRADMTREEFIAEVTEGILPPPQYFPKNARLNREGYGAVDRVMERGARALSPDAFEEVANREGALIIDTRHQDDFRRGFIPNSIFFGIDGGFAPWVGTLVKDLDKPILLVAEPGREEEATKRLARVGYDNALGYLEGGIESWRKAGRELDTIDSITAPDLLERLDKNEASDLVLDVRKPTEFEAGHLDGALNTPLDYMSSQMEKLDREHDYLIHCRSGYRSMIFASILKSRGFDRVADVAGGWRALEEARATS